MAHSVDSIILCTSDQEKLFSSTIINKVECSLTEYDVPDAVDDTIREQTE